MIQNQAETQNGFTWSAMGAMPKEKCVYDEFKVSYRQLEADIMHFLLAACFLQSTLTHFKHPDPSPFCTLFHLMQMNTSVE